MIITLDGPAGSGKSTVACELAKRLKLPFLDTGAMYRGVTAACLDRGIDPASHPESVASLVRESRIWFAWKRDPPALHVDEVDMTTRLRDPDTTKAVSDVAAMPEVRTALVDAQRRISADLGRLVTEGRDQGSIVFPDARVKFYLDARPTVRARRRAQEMRDAGQQIDEGEMLEQLRHRDRRDTTRQDGPLICPSDAIRLDTSEMGLGEVVDRVEVEARRIIGDQV